MDLQPARNRGVNQAILATTDEALGPEELAFDQLYRANRDDVYAYTAALLRDASAAEEVTAVAFERAYRKRRRFDPGRGAPRAWLFAIARNAALDELRRRRHQTRLSADPVDSCGPGAAEGIEFRERHLALEAALAELSGPERELIALKFFAGLGNAEIGAVLGISESNAGTRLHRTMNKLREVCPDEL